MSARKIESFDVSLKQRAILEWRYARRTQLRQQYLKECLNPAMRAMPPVGTAVQRLISLRNSHEYLSNMKLMPHILFGFAWSLLIFSTVKIIGTLKDNDEKLYRSGQVKYADREFMFA